jgi:hypothetical protein
MPNKPNAVELAREQLLEDAELIVACYKAGSDYVCEGDYNCARYVLRVQPVVEAARDLRNALRDSRYIVTIENSLGNIDGSAAIGQHNLGLRLVQLEQALAALEGGGEE